MRARYLATKTAEAIDRAMRADGGASFRQWQQKILPHLDDAYRGADDPWRSHLGASVMGNECGRALWYGFRWATLPEPEPRMLRLWNRGHLEEGRFIALLLMIGVQVYQQDANGKQYRISDHHGHYGGSGDGFGIGVPDLPPDQPAALECKTHNDKSFTELKDKGVRDAKFDHFVQMQQYMRKFNLAVCLYMAVNKNTDELYLELVMLDSALADQFIERAGKIIWMQEAPQKMQNASAGWWKCKWCDHRPVCHLNAPPAKNCRTCRFSTPLEGEGGQWGCSNPSITPNVRLIPKEVQLTGCDYYEAKKM